jgi:hypothetical protein
VIPTRNLLEYPAGIAPGFDPTHPAARNNIFTGVAGPRFRSITRPSLVPSVSGAETYAIDRAIGPTSEYATTGGWTLPAGTLPGTAFPEFTIATIYYMPAATANVWFFCIGQFGCVLYHNFSAGNILYYYSDAASNGAGVGAQITGDPALVIYSANAAGYYFVYRNLRTGYGQYLPVASSGAMAANDGSVWIGGANGRIASSMFSASYLQPVAAQTWALDPWSFWYPDV